MSPEKWGGLYEKIFGIYSFMLKSHGILPSWIDSESAVDFIYALQSEDIRYVSIDNVGGW